MLTSPTIPPRAPALISIPHSSKGLYSPRSKIAGIFQKFEESALEDFKQWEIAWNRGGKNGSLVISRNGTPIFVFKASQNERGTINHANATGLHTLGIPNKWGIDPGEATLREWLAYDYSTLCRSLGLRFIYVPRTIGAKCKEDLGLADFLDATGTVDGIFQQFEPDCIHALNDPNGLRRVNPKNIQQAALFHMALANADGHGENILLQYCSPLAEDFLILIDHGAILPKNGESGMVSFFLNHKALDSIVDPSIIEFLKKVETSDFEKILTPILDQSVRSKRKEPLTQELILTHTIALELLKEGILRQQLQLSDLLLLMSSHKMVFKEGLFPVSSSIEENAIMLISSYLKTEPSSKIGEGCKELLESYQKFREDHNPTDSRTCAFREFVEEHPFSPNSSEQPSFSPLTQSKEHSRSTTPELSDDCSEETLSLILPPIFTQKNR